MVNTVVSKTFVVFYHGNYNICNKNVKSNKARANKKEKKDE